MFNGAKSVPYIIPINSNDMVASTEAFTFRYAVVSAKAGRFTVSGAYATSTLDLHVPFGTPYPGNFRCSSPQITRVWYAGT